MISLALATLATLGAAATAPHEIAVDHRGTGYQVSYRPQVETRVKTVGAAAGTRMSQQRCRWAMVVQVERQVRSAGGAPDSGRLLPRSKELTGERPGSCIQNRGAIDADIAARADAVRAHVAEVARSDRPALLADIDAARSLALN
jgi:hypothetical protein